MRTYPKARFVVDESGRKSAAVLSIRDYKRLLEAWEEVADAEDFAVAGETAAEFITVEKLRTRVGRKR